MTEQDWLTSTDPAAMLEWGTNQYNFQVGPTAGRMISDRKLRLWATAWWSQWQPHEHTHALRVKEVLGGKQDWRRLVAELNHHGLADPERRKVEVLRPVGAALLRDVAGNPWRPPLQLCGHHSISDDCPCCQRIRTPTVLALVQAAYSERREDGALDPDRLLILADALEEAGCTDEFLLSHLRGLELIPDGEMPNKYRWHRLRGPHVRGCWAVDALLGKEAAG